MGKELEYIVKGAMAQCNQSKVPMIAQLQLIADNLFDKVNGNFFASDKTLGPVFGPAPFGICNMIPPTPAVPTPPCVCVITAWTGAEDSIIHNKISHPLTTDSKGTCALGGSISFKMSGQFPKPSVPATGVASMGDMNPLSDGMMRKINSGMKKGENGPLYMHYDGDMTSIALLCGQLDSQNLEYKMVETDKGVAIAILGIKGGQLETMKEINGKKENDLPSCGVWDDENKKGDSVFHPQGDPPEGYPPNREGVIIERKPWGQSGEEGTIIGDVEKMVNEHRQRNGQPQDYKFNGVEYKDGEANFGEHCLGEVKMETYSLDRETNFQRARELMAEDLNRRHPEGIKLKDGTTRPYRASDVKKWMKDKKHPMTWHECQDRTTMQKVPSVLHGNIKHTGGISKEKGKMNEMFGLTEDTQDYNQMIALSASEQENIEAGKEAYVQDMLAKKKKEAEAGKYTTHNVNSNQKVSCDL